jgi:para-aminobenzoate synthetase/4-amino-4-deoxychorismate lyase
VQSPVLKPFTEFPARYYALLTRRPGTVLLHTSRFDAENCRSYLLLDPSVVLTAGEGGELSGIFEEVERRREGGAFVAGFLSYEAGGHFERIRCEAPVTARLPMAWFGVYSRAYVFDHRAGRFEGESPEEWFPEAPVGDEGYAIGNLRFGISPREYANKVEAIQEYIRAGDVYQVNLTGKVNFDFSGSPAAMFAALSAQQSVSYGAFLCLGETQLLSFSPELFFCTRGGGITARPMKGTACRGRDMAEDAAMASWLQNDPKNRSENIMITDLLRSDLGRICRFGSIRAKELLAVEKYETLFQMTSTVSGTLRPGLHGYDIFAALFPCGSVTGAPKVRAMEIIRELEGAPRGVYTGAIGLFSPGGEIMFNVAIRTIVLEGGRGEMGVGSGIVIDSVAKDEYQECLLKAEFLTHGAPRIQLIESLLWDGEYPFLPFHQQRLEASAASLGFAVDGEAVTALLSAKAQQLRRGARYKVRLLLDRSGAISCEAAPLEKQRELPKIMISAMRTCSSDTFLRHKTTRRQAYDQWLSRAHRRGFDEVLFLNERGEVTEGAISNIFIECGGQWFTPPVSCGLLPGVYRRHLLETNSAASERILCLEDLRSADAIYICNAVRGLRQVTLEACDSMIPCKAGEQ